MFPSCANFTLRASVELSKAISRGAKLPQIKRSPEHQQFCLSSRVHTFCSLASGLVSFSD